MDKKKAIVLYILAAVIAVVLIIIYRRTILKTVGFNSINDMMDGNNVVAIATKEIGVRETTQNRGVQVEIYLKSVGLDYSHGYTYPGFSWCAAFVKWCMIKANIVTPGMNAMAASCYNPDNVVYSDSVFHKAFAPGDIFTIYFESLGRVGHCGIISNINGNILSTIEGNTNNDGSRNGNGVYARSRNISEIHSISRWV